MRVDGASNHPSPVNPYNAATEKAVVAKRSFQLRKKLAKRAANPQGWAGLDQAAMIGQWMNGGHDRAKTENQRQHGGAARG
jgi:hypothetical protein